MVLPPPVRQVRERSLQPRKRGQFAMTSLNLDTIRAALSAIRGPNDVELLSAGQIQGLTLRDGAVSFVLDIGAASPEAMEPTRQASIRAVEALPGVKSVTAVMTADAAARPQAPRARQATINAGVARETAPPAPAAKTPLPGVAAIIGVASGKGGVGKSTVAVNLALALSRLGLRIGLLDADIYGPSVPRLLGLKGKPVSKDGKRLEPMEAYGIKAMSIGLLFDPDSAAIWRGPVATTALNQLMTDTNWGELDALIIDMPPGTGDIHLTLAQRVAMTGAVIVSTPQDIALIDARKGLAMFRRVAVPVLGIVENMSVYACPNCGHQEHIFGDGGAKATAKELDVPLLAEIPLRRTIRETSDAGTPVVVSAPDGPDAKIYVRLAEAVIERMTAQDARPAPRIVMLP
jgi:ATP-binding protein involved in chromosome partitioning